MAQSLLPTPRPPQLGDNFSTYIVVVAVLFIIVVFLFYYYSVHA